MNRLKRCSLILCMALLAAGCGGSKSTIKESGPQQATPGRIADLNKQIAKNPQDVALKRQLYQEYLNVDMVSQALNVMEDIMALDAYDMDVRFQYGELQYRQKNFPQAYRAFRAVLQSASGESYKDAIAGYVAGTYLVEQVTSGSGDNGFPSFSPDSKKLVYQKKNGDNWDIAEYDFDSQSERLIVATPANEESPVFSPDGQYIAFTSDEDDSRPIAAIYKAREINLLKLSDNYVSNLTQSAADDWLPRYDGSGKKILFVSERGDLRKVSYTELESDLFVMGNQGTFQHQLTRTAFNEGGGCFSSDGTHIFFHSNKNGNYDIFQMKADGSQVITLIDDPHGDDVNPYPSADGNFLTFVSNRDGNFEIYRSRTDGSNQERLTFNPAEDSSPVFSPDGRSIAFQSDRNGKYDIFLINLSFPASQLTVNDLIERLNKMAGDD